MICSFFPTRIIQLSFYPTGKTISEVSYYEIWRKYGALDWAYYTYVTSSTFTYKDDSLSTVGTGGTTVRYKVRAVQTALPENLTSDFTNDPSIQVSGDDPGKLNIGRNRNEINNISAELYQNYPNPFNPTTMIEFSINENSIVSLKMFDILGREVVTIANEMFGAGNHQVQFDGSNLESGIYFYELKANEFRDVNKFILIK